jgi:trimeric autotransporter adhesin
MKKRNIIAVFSALACFALLPKAQAAPAPETPDPGSVGGSLNTADGDHALFNVTTGVGNAAFGWFSLLSTVDTSLNTGVGAATLVLNTGENNTAIGAAALLFNTTGSDNTAVGAAALVNNAAGGNTAVGSFALNKNTTGTENTAVGRFALRENTIGFRNTATGRSALTKNTEGQRNTATGQDALFSNTLGSDNTADGDDALSDNTEGSFNTAIGKNALVTNTEGSENTAVGFAALSINPPADSNTAVGSNALLNTSSTQNTAVGAHALMTNGAAGFNTAVGAFALQNSTGAANTALGASAGIGVTTAINTICIGASGADVNGSCFIANIRGVTTVGAAIPVLVDANGQLGTASSSRQFKEDIQPMDKASEAILDLKPVTFRYKAGAGGMRQFGLIAEEVAEVNSELVVYDEKGEIYTVRYDAVNAMLLNEFLKEHKKVEEQQASIADLKSTVAQQQKGMEVLTAQLKEQAAQIQKVSAQLEVNKPAPQTVANK